MARRVKTTFNKIRRENPNLYYALTETQGMTTNRAYNHLKKRKVKPMLTRKQLQKIVVKSRNKSGVPITVSKDMLDGHRKADGVQYTEGGKTVKIRVHPILGYYGKRYAQDVIDHELDHAKVRKRILENRKKRRK